MHAAYTHKQYVERTRPETTCKRADLTYGGVCLNCGFDPEEIHLRQAKTYKGRDVRACGGRI